MKLSTTVNLFILPNNGTMQPYFEDLKNYRNLGFEILDCIFCGATSPDSPLRAPDWMDWCKRIAEESERLGITYTQTHMPFYNFAVPGPDPDRDEITRRSIIGASILGSKWIVGHPATAYDQYDLVKSSKRICMEYYNPLVELAQKHGIGVALENMADFPHQGYKRSYCAWVEELCDLVDSFQSENVGICWDFGHANMVYGDQNPCLRQIGTRLKAVHVHDNGGDDDAHLAPFFGNINWKPLMKTLGEIDYSGEFSFEISRIDLNLPKEVKNAQWIYAKTAGEYLLSLV